MHPTLKAALDAQAAGRLEEGKLLFLKHLKEKPGDVPSLYSLASIELQQGRLEQALRYADRAIATRKDFAPSFLARSIILSGLGRPSEAKRDAEIASALDPALPGLSDHLARMRMDSDNPLVAHTNSTEVDAQISQLNAQALALQGEGKSTQARVLFEQTLTLDPENFVALYSMGVLVSRPPFSENPIPYLERAVAAAPTSPVAHFALGTALQNAGLLELALEHFDQAIALDPKYIEPYTNKSGALHTLNRQRDAVLTLEAALQHRPDDPKLLGNKGYLLTEFKENAAAAACFDRMLELDPDYEFGEGLRLYARLHVCDWRDYDELKSRIERGVREGRRVVNPLAFMAISDSAEDQLKCAQTFSNGKFPQAPSQLYRGEIYKHRRKRVAFLSADFREHPVGYLMIGLIEQLPQFGLETIGVAVGIRDASELYRRYRNAFTHYLDCAGMPAAEIAQWLRAMEVDIAIDLSGYTSGTRLDVLSYRPAPRQFTYLGFPGTLALPYIDGLIADPVIAPERLSHCYSEHVYRLPHCYLPRDTSVKPAEECPPRADFGLPETGDVFCAFCHDYKISPNLFRVWMTLLAARPGSVLWLMRMHEDVKRNLIQNAAHAGIAPERLVFATRVPRVEDHLARYRHASVFLDTHPYNGHTTVSDALYSGLPVVTLRGESFASRVATSLLTDLGLEDWSTDNLDDYQRIALDLVSSNTAKMRLAQAKIDKGWPFSEHLQAEALAEILLLS